ncbi:MAG: hypothetical protein PHP31_00780 [Lentimicrobiaceae bacterium]|nr:hypothetical protein [Lentimicrobiaceae bacterium]
MNRINIKVGLVVFSLFALCLTLIVSCKSDKNKVGDELTKRIQYDVPICDVSADSYWWINNIEGIKREEFVKHIFKQVTDGNVVAHDIFSYRQLSAEDVKTIIRRVDTISVMSAQPPYELVDTVLIKEISVQDITKIRFLEEWYFDKKTLQIDKKVKGICPVVEIYNEDGTFRGNKPLFWIFTDDTYPKAFNLVEE